MLFTTITTALLALRLKELLLKERSERTALQTRVEELEERCANAVQQLEQQRSHEAQYKDALHRLQESVSQQEADRATQQVEEVILTVNRVSHDSVCLNEVYQENYSTICFLME